MSTKTPTVPHRFALLVARGMTRDGREGPAEDIRAAAHTVMPGPVSPSKETARYFALCERAWLQWTRTALERVTMGLLGQSCSGTFTPARVTGPGDAAKAQARCAVHLRLLNLAASKRDDPRWEWRVEAARQVHASTERALKVGSTIDPASPPQVAELDAGIQAAADALVASFSAGFIDDPAGEMRWSLELIDATGYPGLIPAG